MTVETDGLREVPYGITDFELIRKENYYYVDKTGYLPSIEKAGRYLFFIRPRRFGKSLLLSVLGSYFDVRYKERFEEFFKGTWIYNNATNERNNYLVLPFNFSVVDPASDRIESSFLNHVRGAAVDFIRNYGDYLSSDREYFDRAIQGSRSASDILHNLLLLCKSSSHKLYVTIDEYDNFANTLLSTVGEAAYKNLTHGSGFFRSFFNVLKGGTTGTGAPIARSFITGVSPITMDDVTSGYNVGQNVSLDADFNRMLGFTRQDVEIMFEYYKSRGLIDNETGGLLEVLDEWYGNYLFSPHSQPDERVYNSDMILYFLKGYFKTHSIPDDLIDRNVRIDYGKLRHLIIVDKDRTGREKPETNGNFSQLKSIIENHGTSARIETGFPLEKLTDPENFKSLLYYLGLLTIKGAEKNKLRLTIPNETVKRLYYDYIAEGYRETNTFSINLSLFSDLMTDTAYDGKWKPLFEFITARMRESISLRDLISGEKSIQAFLNVYLGLSDLYIIHAEKEMNKGYADLVLEPFTARYPDIAYSYVLEIKYLKAGLKAKDVKLESIKETAANQLKQYTLDTKFEKSMAKTHMIKLVLIFSGHDMLHIEKI